jgi:hypothetical protein
LLANCEVRFLTLGLLSFGPGESGPNQAPMDRPVVTAIGVRGVGVLTLSLVASHACHANDVGAVLDDHLEGNVIDERVRFRLGSPGQERIRGGLRRERPCLFPASARRHASLLVFVVGIARRAPGLFHVLLDHGHDDVIGEAALARAVVVQNVTEPKPALFH